MPPPYNPSAIKAMQKLFSSDEAPPTSKTRWHVSNGFTIPTVYNDSSGYKVRRAIAPLECVWRVRNVLKKRWQPTSRLA